MRTLTCSMAAALLLALPAAHAQTTVLAASSAPPPPRSGLPPPGINEPGPKTQSVPLPGNAIPPSKSEALKAREASQQAETVDVHTAANGDVVQEYRRGGRLYMIRVTPEHGVTQTYLYNNPSGSLVRDPRLGPVSPVYYTLYEWGGPSKPASGSSTQ